jgi:superfamily II DNA or RNA helicase
MPTDHGSLRPGDAVRIRSERWTVLHRTAHHDAVIVDVRGSDRHNAGTRACFLLPFEPIDPVAVPTTPRLVSTAEWRLVARHLLARATPRVDSLRTAVAAGIDVMPFQLEPALAITSGAGCRLLIADEVGLGKTVQAALIVAEAMHRVADVHALVVCPAGLRSQWQHELRDRFRIDSVLLDAAGLARVGSTVDSTANPWVVAPVVVTSIDFIKRPEVMRALEGLVWDVLILDEAHNLATRSDRAAAANALGLRARTVVMLSATPHSGDADAFARLCAIGDRQGRFPLLLFRRTRAAAALPVDRHTHWLRVTPTPAEADMHAALVAYARRAWHDSTDDRPGARLAVSVLLRRAASSAAAFERSVERRLALLQNGVSASLSQLALPFVVPDADDDEPGAALAVAALHDPDEERRQLERLLVLARLAARYESKVSALRRFLARTREPMLIFTEYRDTLVRLRQALTRQAPEDGIRELHGGLTRTERIEAARAFTSGSATILLATDAASEGLNLHQRCRCVINLEVPWSPVRLEQRIGRVDRIGQRRRVHAVHLVASGTSESEATRRLLRRAQRAADALINPAPSEVDVADAVLTGVDIVERPPRGTPMSALARPDLRAQATAEAARIATARHLDAAGVVVPHRPVVLIRRARRPAAIWAIEVAVTDAGGAPVWTAVVGLTADTAGPRHDWPRRWKALAGDDHHALRNILDGVARAVVLHAGAVLTPSVLAAADRERAIAAGVRHRHARIAADLLQPGLFDHRTERRAASQTAVLEEALGRCTARLESLERLTALSADPPAIRLLLVHA